MSNTKISVIIPAYNAEKYLGSTIDSVLAQDFEDWEAIIVDDGSTDGTVGIIEGYLKQDPRIRMVLQQNGGGPSARNTGLLHAEDTPYVIFLDHDDVLEPNALSTLYEILESSPQFVAAHGSGRYIDSDGNRVNPGALEADLRLRETYVNGRIVSILPNEPTSFNTFLVACCIRTPGMVLFRRESIRRIGEFDTSLPGKDDWDFYVRLSRYGSLKFVDRVVLNYRIHEKNLSKEKNRRLKVSSTSVRLKVMNSSENTPEHSKTFKHSHSVIQRYFMLQKLKFATQAASKRDWRNCKVQLKTAAGHFVRMVGGCSESLQ